VGGSVRDMKKRKWGATGEVPLGNYTLPQHEQAQIQAELTKRGHPPPRTFFDAIGTAIAWYHAGKAVASASKPATVRQNLKHAYEAALALNEALYKLDWNAWSLVNESGISAKTMHKYANGALKKLAKASTLADEYPQRGALPDNARLTLARHVADAISDHLGITPTTTKAGVFDAVLGIVITVATGRHDPEVHELVRRALAEQ